MHYLDTFSCPHTLFNLMLHVVCYLLWLEILYQYRVIELDKSTIWFSYKLHGSFVIYFIEYYIYQSHPCSNSNHCSVLSHSPCLLNVLIFSKTLTKNSNMQNIRVEQLNLFNPLKKRQSPNAEKIPKAVSVLGNTWIISEVGKDN